MKSLLSLPIIIAATLALSLGSCKKDDGLYPSSGNTAAASATNGSHYSVCDSATNTRMNLDTGKPCRCAL